MVTEKQLNPETFSNNIREFHALGESIRSRQDEKRALLADFQAERERFKAGNISQSTLASTAQRTNKELARLDKEIKQHLTRSNTLLSSLRGTVLAQAPRVIRVNTKGAKAKTAARRVAARRNKTRTARTATRRTAQRTASRTSARRAARTTRRTSRR